ncbi:MAG: VanZ family protein [Candidatus Omnitrophica bacterium]|nr:VanZ family protein [Candidatus Omnitrophota bacterium]MBI3009617.1 VanZ family protein [Candidatus Omnitrophota bacterium]
MILFLSIIPAPAAVGATHLDKVAHVCEYLIFAWLLAQAIRAHWRTEHPPFIWAWIYATSFGLLMELLQALLPWRSADWLDSLSNAMGAALGVWLVKHTDAQTR